MIMTILLKVEFLVKKTDIGYIYEGFGVHNGKIGTLCQLKALKTPYTCFFDQNPVFFSKVPTDNTNYKK